MPEFLQTGPVRTAYDRHGSGPAVLLMHGAEASRLMFAALGERLAAHMTVLAYDQRDCGETQGPAQACTVAELADDAAALIRGLGHERVHVFGSSFGGRVAQALAVRHTGLVDKLALASTWPLPLSLQMLNPVGVARMEALRQGLPDTAEELAGLFFPEAFLQQRPELRRVFAQVQPATERSVRRQQAVDSALDMDWARLRMPVLLLTGSLDQVVPPQLTLGLGEHLAHAHKMELAGIGHATALQAPDLLAEHLLRFFITPHPIH